MSMQNAKFKHKEHLYVSLRLRVQNQRKKLEFLA